MSIQLPSIATVEGVVARLLIAENSTPDFPQYDEAQARLSMNAMKAVIDNRLHNSPSQLIQEKIAIEPILKVCIVIWRREQRESCFYTR